MPGFAISGFAGVNPNVEFHRSHRWQVLDIGAPTGSSSVDLTSRSRSSPPAPSHPRFYAKSLKLPSLSFDEEKVEAGSMTYKFPKRAKWDPVTVEFYDVFGLHKIYDDWMKKVWNPKTGLGLANDFMGEPKFTLTDGQGAVQQTFTLKNAYPLKVDHGQLTYTSSEVKLLIVTYSYSHAVVKIKN